MKKLNIDMCLLVGFASLPSIIHAQIPTEVPHPDNNSPIDISNPADIILYIVLPLIFVILYFVWSKRRKR